MEMETTAKREMKCLWAGGSGLLAEEEEDGAMVWRRIQTGEGFYVVG